MGNMSPGLKVTLWVVGIFVVIGSFVYVAGFKLSAADTPGTTVVSNSGSVPASVTGGAAGQSFCALQPSLGVTARDKYNGTTLAAPTLIAFINGQRSSTTSSPINVDIGKPIQVLMDDGQHYQAFADITNTQIGCGVNTVVADIYPNATLSNNTFSTTNQEQAVALAANDRGVQKLYVKVGANQAFSNPLAPANVYPVICLDMNQTEITTVYQTGGSDFSTPSQHTTPSGYKTKCYTAPFHDLKNGADTTINYEIQSSGTNPGTSYVGGTIYDVDAYVFKDGTIQWGVEDASTGTGVDVGGVKATFALRYS